MKTYSIAETCEIKEIAHKIWTESGCPDGEQLIYSHGKWIKLKDFHWQNAITEWTYGPDYFRSH